MDNGNMVKVSKDVFYDVIGTLNLNVHPELGLQQYDQVIGYKAHWKRPNGELLGLSFGIEHLHNMEYWVTTDILSQYQSVKGSAISTRPQSSLFDLPARENENNG
jgi:hypothetical protein